MLAQLDQANKAWWLYVQSTPELFKAAGTQLDNLAELHGCEPRRGFWVFLESDFSLRDRLIKHLKKNYATPERVKDSS